ncbi:MAG: hypothetical protein JNL11_15045 [Bdellovibrionaceae bacterium]|nr:hypothetical protein [Pseudobdellovibrionaceae bacterium]
MSKKSKYTAAVDFDEEEMKVELVGIVDTSDAADSRRERVEKLVAKIILLGQTRGRPRKEALHEEQIAA